MNFNMLDNRNLACFFLGVSKLTLLNSFNNVETQDERPNILLVISDDQSWTETGINGCKTVNTPVFDSIARNGIYFKNAFCNAPHSSASRATLLTGRYSCALEEAGTHFSHFPDKFKVFPSILEAFGYQTGYIGKGWEPGDWQNNGWPHNPAGRPYNDIKINNPPLTGLSKINYAENFKHFLNERDTSKPFCMWVGIYEPHHQHEVGSGLRVGKKLEDVRIPAFFPDTEKTRNFFLDYGLEIEWFDKQLGKILEHLKSVGELENTLIIVTGDNGTPIDRAKADIYEYGTHVPMAAIWPAKAPGGRIVDDLVSFVDFAPTFLEAAGLTPNDEIQGKSFLNILLSNQEGKIDKNRGAVFTQAERFSHQRFDNLGYPMRAIRDDQYLYIRNFKSDRWPICDPPRFKRKMLKYPDTKHGRWLFDLTYAKRPSDELYDITRDSACIYNLADSSEFIAIKEGLREKLDNKLIDLGDPRMLGYGDIFDSYPRFGRMSDELGGFNKRGEYNPKYHREKPVVQPGKFGSEYPISEIYTIEVNGKDIPVYSYILNNKLQYHYCVFSFSTGANIRIKATDKIDSFIINSISNVLADKYGNYLNFEITQPAHLDIDINEGNKLLIFANGLETE